MSFSTYLYNTKYHKTTLKFESNDNIIDLIYSSSDLVLYDFFECFSPDFDALRIVKTDSKTDETLFTLLFNDKIGASECIKKICYHNSINSLISSI